MPLIPISDSHIHVACEVAADKILPRMVTCSKVGDVLLREHEGSQNSPELRGARRTLAFRYRCKRVNLGTRVRA